MNQTQLTGQLTQPLPSAAKMLLALLGRLTKGYLLLVTPEGHQHTFGNLHQSPHATLQILDWRACGRILRGGDIGFAECVEQGWVATPDLTALLRLAIQNQNAITRAVHGGMLVSWWYRLRHWLRPNTRAGSKRNIHAHYDLGNDFYQLWLDPSMTYSSALFAGDYSLSLADAQARKYQSIIDELHLVAGDHVLEIGCGWGGFAEHASALGIKVTGVTISAAQLQFARERMQRLQREHLVDLQLCDYRDLRGEYDAVVSIEMVEAVGERYWPEYFATVAARLRSGGRAVIQSITINEADFERYRSSTDFIQQYIFPGGMLPSPERFSAQAACSGLVTEQSYRFGADYAETLRRWHRAWELSHDTILQQGFDARFMRIWRLYYAYCEAGFDEGKTDVVQFLLHKTA